MSVISAKIVFLVLVSIATTHADASIAHLASRYTQIHPRIIGGNEVHNRCFAPYNSVVALTIQSPNAPPFLFCAGTLYDEYHVLVPAFCIYQARVLDNNQLVIVVGERDSQMTDTTEQSFFMESYRSHPKFNASTQDNDIAIIRLSGKVTFNNCVQPALKMETDDTACNDFDDSCVMMGWGAYIETGKPVGSRLLRQAPVTVLGDIVSKLWSRKQQDKDPPVGAVYAESKNPNIKACFFDWGDPISCRRNNKYVLSGLISDHNCNSDRQNPIIVTDIPFFQIWINRCLSDWARCVSSTFMS